MSNIKFNPSNQVSQPALRKAQPKQQSPLNKVETKVVEPQENVSLSSPVVNQEQKASTPIAVEKPAKEPVVKRREPSGEMAQMLQDIQSPSGIERPGVGPNGTIVMMSDDSFVPPKQTETLSPGESVLKQVAASVEKEAKESKDAKGSKSRANQMKAGTATHAGPLEIVEVAGVKAYKAAKAAKEIITEKASAVAGEVTPEMVVDGVQATQSTKLVSEVGSHAGKLSMGMETALKVAGGASAILAPIMIGLGLKEFNEGRKEKSADKMLEGAAATTVGVRSGVAAAVMGKMAGVVKLGAEATAVAKTALPVLGVAHGVLDIAIGARQVAKGKTTKGLLNIGFGSAVTATVLLGLGLPGVGVAATIMGAKIVHGVASSRKEKKAKAAAEQQQQAAQPQAQVAKPELAAKSAEQQT